MSDICLVSLGAQPRKGQGLQHVASVTGRLGRSAQTELMIVARSFQTTTEAALSSSQTGAGSGLPFITYVSIPRRCL